MKQTLEQRQDEKDRLAKKYRAAKRAQWDELCEAEPRLPGLRTAIRRSDNPTRLLRGLADSWIRSAPREIRHAAMGLIQKQEDAVRRRNGFEPFDDPLPPQRSVYFVAKELLNVR